MPFITSGLGVPWLLLVFTGGSTQALCTLAKWPLEDAPAPPMLFWLHVPKTGTSFRKTVVDYACPKLGHGNRLTSGRQAELINQSMCAHRFDAESYSDHKSVPTTSCGSAMTMLREPRSRLISAFHFGGGGGMHGLSDEKRRAELLELSYEARLRAYSKSPEVRNVQTKMVLGLHRYAKLLDAQLDAGKAKHLIRNCFCFVGDQGRWTESAWLFNNSMAGAQVSPIVTDIHENKGSYAPDQKASDLQLLDDYEDLDTALFRESTRLIDERINCVLDAGDPVHALTERKRLKVLTERRRLDAETDRTERERRRL